MCLGLSWHFWVFLLLFGCAGIKVLLFLMATKQTLTGCLLWTQAISLNVQARVWQPSRRAPMSRSQVQLGFTFTLTSVSRPCGVGSQTFPTKHQQSLSSPCLPVENQCGLFCNSLFASPGRSWQPGNQAKPDIEAGRRALNPHCLWLPQRQQLH